MKNKKGVEVPLKVKNDAEKDLECIQEQTELALREKEKILRRSPERSSCY